MTEQIIDGQAVEVPDNGRALATVGPAGLPTFKSEDDVDRFVAEALLQWKAYQKLTVALLDDTDYQKIGNRQFKKKSAWRKYARAFNISCEKLSEEITRDEDAWPVYARVVVRAISPDGRYQDGDQECHANERCCSTPCRKSAWKGHYCCVKDCDGRVHFSHPGDLPATAFTRAKNRAIADLIGAGEVSAEEMSDTEAPADSPRRSAAPVKAPPPEERTPAPGPTGKANDQQVRAIGKMKTAIFGEDERAYYDWMKEVCPAACGDTNVTAEILTSSEAAAVIKAMNEKAAPVS